MSTSMDWLPTDMLWRTAIAVIPLAILVGVLCRVVPCRPSTRHALWLVVLTLLVAAPLVPRAPLFALGAAVDAVSGFAIVRPPVSVAQSRDPVATQAAPRTDGVDAIAAPPPSIARVTPRPHTPRRVPPPEVGIFQFADTAPAARAPAAAAAPNVLAERKSLIDARRAPPAGPSGTAGAMAAAGAAPTGPRPSAPTAPPASAPAAPDMSDADPGSAWRQWAAVGIAIRDAVMSLPPLPAGIWLGGIAILVTVASARISRSLRLVRAGTAAPPSVVRMVAEAARDLRLRRPPVTLMVEQTVSPMLWCGRRACIILPRPLWSQLDDVGRRAVIFHELAHLRRRDHLVCWAEMVVGAIYWWHPVVWWVRRRLRDEADLCCDAWVTTLMPQERRAYAQALLETRRHSSLIPRPHPTVPSVGLGVMTARARRFARRLTMVMTEHTPPGLSRKGVLLTCCIALGGLLTTPLWACPPTEQPDPVCKPQRPAKAPKAAKPAKPQHKLIVPQAPVPPATPAPPDTTFEQFMRDRAPGHDGSMENRIREIERQLERLYQRLEELQRELSGLLPGGEPPPAVAGIGDGSGIGPAFQVYGMLAPVAVGQSASSDGNCLAAGASDEGAVVVVTHKLPQGKREALTALMVLEDVPIRVRPLKDGIEVHATPKQQCVFELFCTMINGEERKEAYRLSKDKLEALSELMVRSDVPLFVEPGDREIAVHGTDLEQAVFGAFVGILGGSGAHAARSPEGNVALAELARNYESAAGVQMEQLAGVRAGMRALEAQAEELARQAEELGEKAESLEEKADDYEQEAAELEEEAQELQGARREKAMSKSQSLRVKAEALRQQSVAMYAQSEMLQEQAEALLVQAEELQGQLEELEGEDEDEYDDYDEDDSEDEDEDEDEDEE